MCEHVFHPEDLDWSDDRGEVPASLPWQCPHEPVKEGLCIFHLPSTEKDPEKVEEAFFEKIETGEREDRVFFDVDIPTLDFSFRNLSTQSHVRIISSDIGELKMVESHLPFPLFVNECTVDQVHISRSSFQKAVSFGGSVLKSNSKLSDAEFTDCVFSHCEFEGGIDFMGTEFNRGDFQSSTFHGTANYEETTFTDHASFLGAEFHSKTVFRNSDFGSCGFGVSVEMEEAEGTTESAIFHMGASFRSITVREECAFDEVKFGSRAIFTGMTSEGLASFKYMESPVKTELDHAEFHDHALFSGSLLANLDLMQSEFHKKALFEDTKLRKLNRFSHGKYNYLALEPIAVDDTLEMKLLCVDISEGNIHYPEGCDTNYIFTGAHLGDVTFHSEREDNLFDHILFRDTTFDGFIFSDYSPELEDCDWKVHESTAGYELEPDEIERTYMKAKNGANRVDDSRSASKFHYRQLDHRRQRYWKEGKYGEWIKNNFHRVISGYGEKPSRVLMLIPVILVFYGLGEVSEVSGLFSRVFELLYLVLIPIFSALLIHTLGRSIDR
jgi:uncharacterized protein YjbI with pentapeptide repeats